MSLTSGLDDVAVLSVTRQGVALSQRLEAALPARLTVYASEKYADNAPAHYHRFPDRLQPVVDAAWAKHEALIFIGAAGIAVRMIAPHVLDKRYDPGVVVVDIQGRFAIALCSGHLGGANELARRIGEAIGAIPVVTTGTDVVETLAPDVLAKQLGAAVENWDALKIVSGALVDGRRVGVLTEHISVPDMDRFKSKNVHRTDNLDGFDAGVGVTPRLHHTATPTIWLRPRVLHVGVGCNSGTSEAEIAEVIDAVLAEHGLSALSVAGLATIRLKASEPGLVAFAAARGWSITAFSAEDLNACEAPYERSETVHRFVGAWGVAEPACILAAGAVRAVVPKVRRGNVTVAVAIQGDS